MLKQSHYDVCIVGAGVAGALVGTMLARMNKKVLIIEAGGAFDFNNRLEQLKRYEVLAEPMWPWVNQARDHYVDSSMEGAGFKYRLNRSRIKGVGGSTLHWGGKALRFRETDFTSHSTYGLGVDWPIDYNELEPYYTKAEYELGVSGIPNASDPHRSKPFPMPGFQPRHGEQFWESAAKKLGISLDSVSHARNSVPYKGRSPCVAYAVCSVCPSGARYSADVHIKEAMLLENFQLISNASARRIITDANGKVTELHATTQKGKDLEVKATNFVIAAHAIETARLMLLSNIGNQSGQLGKNLMEHWYAGAGGFVKDRVEFPGRIGFSTLESSHYYDGPDRKERGALHLEFSGYHEPLLAAGADKLWGADLAQKDCDEFGRWVGLAVEVEHQPNANSFVKLHTDKKDMFGDPVPHIQFTLSDIDRKTHERGHEIMATLLEARGVSQYKRTHNFVRAHHHMGTCRMSFDGDNGVVDKNCKVFGTENLYIAGSSVFPTSGARQPTLTIAALAIRLAEYLSK